MKFDFPKKIRSGYVLVFLLLLLCYFLSLSSFIQLRKQNKWVGHTREVINKLSILNANLKDAEISWHEYLLSKEEMYLNAYKGSRAQVDSEFQVLSGFVNDNPAQKKRLQSMYEMIVRKSHMLEEQLGILNKNHFQINDSVLNREQQNKLLIDSIDKMSDSITANENKLLFLRTQKVIFYSKIVFWIIIGAGLVSSLLIIYSLVTFNMESKAKK